MDEQIELTVSDHRSRFNDRLKAIDTEFAVKGLFRSGPRIRSAVAAMKDHYTQLGKRLLAQAEVQPNPEAADQRVMTILRDEYDRLRDRLTEIVKSTDGGEDALNAAQQLLEPARQEIESLASIPRVARASQDVPKAATGLASRSGAATASGVTVAASSGTASASGSAEAIGEAVLDARSWTGNKSRTARFVALRAELDTAHAAVGYLIDELAETDGNGGPILDEHSDALEELRNLHRTLGELLTAIDRGVLDDELGEGLAAEIARYAGNAVETLRNEPARFVIGATICAVLSACGLGDLGGFLSGAAISIRKTARKD